MIRWLVFALLITFANPAFAACSNPARPKGTIYFESAYDALIYCNDTDWVMMGIGSYNPNAVNFDGTNDWLSVGGGLSVSDSNKLSGSFWIRRNGGTGAARYVFNGGLQKVYVGFNASDQITIYGDKVGVGTALDLRGSTAIADTNWHHVIFSIDLSDTAKRFIYLDDAPETLVVTTYNTADTIDFTYVDHVIGSTAVGGSKFSGDLAEVWIDFGSYIDLSVAANRAKFRSTNGMPKYLGPDGAIPTGTAPDIFLSGDTASWETNKGTGGGFTENGALTTAATQPADSIITGTCTGPGRPAGVMFFNQDYRVMQYCNGKEWVAMGPIGGSDATWKMISAGQSHSCGIKSDDTLWCWGLDSSGQVGDGPASTGIKFLPVQVGTDTWKMVSMGNTHTCGIKTDNTAWCWGSDTNGRLGNGGGGNTDSPGAVNDGGATWKVVDAGNTFSCGIKTDDTAWCWGGDASGQLGNGATSTDQQSPVAVTGGATWKSINGGSLHTCGIKSDDTGWCWGTDTNLQLGNGVTTGDQVDPVALNDGGATWKVIAPGVSHTCGIKLSDNTAWCWGSDSNGRMGNGAGGNTDSPGAVNDGGATWKSITSSSDHSCGIKTDDSAWCWGDDSTSQLGDGAATGPQQSPVAVSGGSTWKVINAGNGATTVDHTCAIKTDNTLWCWGSDTSGQLGNESVGDANIPVAVAGGATWKMISAGQTHSCGIKSDDTGWCWGIDSSNQLGNGASTTSQASPVALNDGGATWKMISAGNSHSCGIKMDNTGWCWGTDTSGQLGNGAGGNADSPTALNDGGATWKVISAGSSHSCGIKSDDTGWCWGSDGSGQVGNGATTGNQTSPVALNDGGATWKSIVAGPGSHSCGIKTDDSAWCWGSDTNGQIGDGAGTGATSPAALNDGGATWKVVAVGQTHTCGIKLSDNTGWCWGLDTSGQVGDGAGTSGTSPVSVNDGGATWKTIATGNNHTCGIKTNDTAWCWGESANYQLGNGGDTTDQINPVTVSDGGAAWNTITGGNQHSCGIKTDDTAWCWGESSSGQIGLGYFDYAEFPVEGDDGSGGGPPPGPCTNPAQPAGMMFYNADYDVMQYCNGTNWVGIGK